MFLNCVKKKVGQPRKGDSKLPQTEEMQNETG
jgi:hypothetical protein